MFQLLLFIFFGIRMFSVQEKLGQLDRKRRNLATGSCIVSATVTQRQQKAGLFSRSLTYIFEGLTIAQQSKSSIPLFEPKHETKRFHIKSTRQGFVEMLCYRRC